MDAHVAQRLRIRISGPAVRVAGANVSFSVPHTSLSTGYHYINMISEMIRALHQRGGGGTHPPLPPPPHWSVSLRDRWVVHLTTPFDPIFFKTFFHKRQTSSGQGHEEDGQGQRDKGCRPQASTSCGTQLYSLSIDTTPPLIARACR